MCLRLVFTLACAMPLIGLHAAYWPLDEVASPLVLRGGKALPTTAGHGKGLGLDGDALLEVEGSAGCHDEFTLSLWFNPQLPGDGQQVLAGKNRYSQNQRQWSLTIETDGHLKAHLQQKGWRSISGGPQIKAGQWHQAVLVVSANKASLYLQGQPLGEIALAQPIAATKAPITLGGIWDRSQVQQGFVGALDEVRLEPRAMSAAEVAAAFHPVTDRHALVTIHSSLPLWDPRLPMPKISELQPVQGARFALIKPAAPDVDQCRFTLGVGMVWHRGLLYASYGFNRGLENTPSEEAHVRCSADGGLSWGPSTVMDEGAGDLAVSHGSFLSHQGRLWAFMGAFHAHEKLYHRVHTRAYRLDEGSGQWEKLGLVIDDGFWPMQEPQRMSDGNWIMAGLHLSEQGKGLNGPAVAISSGDDFTRWRQIVLPIAPSVRGALWGESTVIVDGPRITNLSRYGRKACALISSSEDHGRSWSASTLSNLPMATSKPYAGLLSNGQRYLVCTTTADSGGRRSPLTIALTRPGESLFSKVLLIRHSLDSRTPGISHAKADFSYPYAVEHEGHLYIGYTHKSHFANELAILPLSSLKLPSD